MRPRARAALAAWAGLTVFSYAMLLNLYPMQSRAWFAAVLARLRWYLSAPHPEYSPLHILIAGARALPWPVYAIPLMVGALVALVLWVASRGDAADEHRRGAVVVDAAELARYIEMTRKK
ncbi:MAG: hypothetical protein ACYDBH_09135 [Acidobacteriaceae bacterium]